MRISIGSDHRGIEQRAAIAQAISTAGLTVDDCGTFSTESVDYPNIAAAVAKKVADGESEMGVLLCGTGIGVSIAANKFAGIRAALCCDEEAARLSRQHNNANVLCLAASKTVEELMAITTAWLSAQFEGGRHARRIEKIADLENPG